MKLNGQNIIKDTDITLTNGNTLNNELKTVKNDINKLQSNVKFIYKHGTLGGGSYTGGGGESTKSAKLSFYLEQEGVLMPVEEGKPVYYSKEGNYGFKIRLFGVNIDSYYTVTIYYAKGINPRIITLSSANNFTYSDSLRLTSNNDISIEVEDNYGDKVISYKCSYYTSIYTLVPPMIIGGYKKSEEDVFNKDYLDNSQNASSNNIISMKDYASKGLMVGFYLGFEIPPSNDSYIEYIDWLGNQYKILLTDLGFSLDRSSYQTIFFNLTGDQFINAYEQKIKQEIDTIEFLSNDKYAGTYECSIRFNIKVGDSNISDTVKLKNSIIPHGEFLMVETNSGRLYNTTYLHEEVIECPEVDQFLMGSSQFYVTPYQGQRDDSRTHTVSVSISYHWNETENNFEVEDKVIQINGIDNTIVQDRNRTPISIPLLYPGYTKITFNVVSNKGKIDEEDPGEYEGVYYIMVKNLKSNFDWFGTKKLLQIKSQSTENIHASFKKSFELDEYHNKNIIYNGKELTSLSSIIMSTNDQPRLYKFNIREISNWQAFDQLLELSIQYSKINNTDTPIFSLNAKGSSKDQIGPHSIFVYQNKIEYVKSSSPISGNIVSVGTVASSKEFFIPLSNNFIYDDKSQYSLLSIYKQIENIESNEIRCSLCALVNGIYDSALPSFDTSYQLFDSITFYPGNYSVNLIETVVFPHSYDSVKHHDHNDNIADVTTGERSYMTLYDLENYYYSYQSLYKSVEIDDTEKQLIDHFKEFTKDEELNLIRCTSDSAQNIANCIDIPVLVLSYTNNDPDKKVYGKIGLEGWLSHSYEESDDSNIVPVTIKWQKSKNQNGLTEIQYDGNPATFYIEVQGSTTKKYFAKNLELIAPSSPTGGTMIFSPNITHDDENSEDFKDMLLPEHSFTLKADVVDSSHSNNNAIGKFVNDNLHPFQIAKDLAEKELRNIEDEYKIVGKKYVNKIKSCLTGFPILVFLNTAYGTNDTNKEENYYYLGIYNFNLGRKSEFNLGYNKLNNLIKLIENNQNKTKNGFVLYDVTDIEKHEGIFVAEVKHNNEYFDFSQYDTSILYKDPKYSGDNLYMFGNFVYGTNENIQKPCLTNLVEHIAKTGGYIFYKLGKTFSDDPNTNYGYNDWYSHKDDEGNPIEGVPNFLYQAKRNWINNKWEHVFTDTPILDLSNPNDRDSLYLTFSKTLSETEDLEGNINIPLLDYTSVSEYYTTCMAFGMIDSVEKNLNIKSWTSYNIDNPGTFYPAFYDMDTALGITNTGTRMNYFSFSDYWESVVDNRNVLQMVKIIRDWSPTKHVDESDENNADAEVKYFDVPSSYLFGIAKYAPMLSDSLSDYPSFNNHPSELWAKWRQPNTSNDPEKIGQGCLQNAKYFVDTYFKNHLSKLPISAINWNYQYKYFIIDSSKEKFNDVNFVKFYGTKIAYTENWLNDRLHIMDAYMNMGQLQMDINGIEVLKPNSSSISYNNDDIIILREIFSTSNDLRYTNPGAIQFNVNAIPYSPIIINIDNNDNRLYLFPSDKKEHTIELKNMQGQPKITYYGSSNWYSLDSIVPFINENSGGSLSINSNYFNNLVGKTQKCEQWVLNTPSIKNIELTSSNYKGSLRFDNSQGEANYPNLDSINISNSSISLYTNSTNISTLIANYMKNVSITCLNVNSLSNVSLSGSFTSIEIDAWDENIYLPSNTYASFECPEILIRNTRFEQVNVYIQNSTSLKTLTLDNCSSLTIDNCPNVKEIRLDNKEDKVQFTSFKFNGGNTKKTSENILKVSTSSNIDSTPDGIVDLSFCNQLNCLSVQHINIKQILLPNNNNHIIVPDSAFSHNPNFVGFSGSQIIDENNPLEIKYNTTNVTLHITGANTFYNCANFNLYQANTIEPEFIKILVDDTCTSLHGTFAIEQDGSIVGSRLMGKIDYNGAKYFLNNCKPENGSHVENVTSINLMFGYQPIDYSLETGILEYKDRKCSLSLAPFVGCQSFRSVFINTNMEFINRYMFGNDGDENLGFAKNYTNVKDKGFEYLSVVKNSGKSSKTGSAMIYVTYDFLYEIIDKITSLTIGPAIKVINPDVSLEVSPTPIEIRQIFNPLDPSADEQNKFKYPENLRYIQEFEISAESTNTFKFDEIFNNHWLAAVNDGLSIQSFLATQSYKVSSYSESGLNNLFISGDNTSDKCKIKLDLFEQILCNISNGETTENLTDAVDISTLFNWDAQLNNIKIIGSNGNKKSFGFRKTITYTKFKELFSKLLGFEEGILQNIEQLNDLFASCIIKDSNDEINDHFILVKDSDINKQNTKITIINNLFTELKILDSENNIKPIPLTWQTLYCLPKIKKASNTFSNIYIKYPISFDFFHKRKETIKDVYVDSSHTNMAKFHIFEYEQELENIQGCFSNITLPSSQYFKENEVYNQDFNGNSVIVHDYIELNGNKYNEYYIQDEAIELQQPSEIIDITTSNKAGYSTYCQTYLDYQATETTTVLLENHINYAYDKYDPNDINNMTIITGSFVSPDILYGCTTSTKMSSLFSYSKLEDNIIFSGTIPEHMLYRYDNKNSEYQINFDIRNINQDNIQLIFNNLNILPIKIWENTENNIKHMYYYFIPKYFIKSTYVQNVFTFKMLMPRQEPNYHEHFFVYLHESIPQEIRSISNSIPQLTTSQMGKNTDNSYKIENYARHNGTYIGELKYPIYLSIMGHVKYDENTHEIIDIIEGFDTYYFSRLLYGGIYSNSELMMIIYGRLLREGNNSFDPTHWNYENMLGLGVSNMITIDSVGLSYYAKIFLPKENIHYISFGSTSVSINKNSIDPPLTDYNDLDDSWNKITWM